MAKAFFISEDDAVVLREVISDHRRRNRGLESSGIPIDDTDDQLTPEVYIIRVPFTGIPARTFVPIGFTGGYYLPGRAECEVWKIFPVDRGFTVYEHVLTKTHFTIMVNNLSWNPIHPYYDTLHYNEFRIARRDKFGDWIVECNLSCGEEGTGTGTTGTGTGTTGTGTTGTGTGTTGTGTTGTGTTGTGTPYVEPVVCSGFCNYIADASLKWVYTGNTCGAITNCDCDWNNEYYVPYCNGEGPLPPGYELSFDCAPTYEGQIGSLECLVW